MAFVLLMLALSGCSTTGVPKLAPGAPIALPDVGSVPTISSQKGLLHITLDAVMDDQTATPVFAYDGAIGVAPTMRVRPGDTIFLTLRNRLPLTNYTPNAVNVHFHGFDVSPTVPEDDVVTTLAQPRQTIHYVIHIPKTQQPGLYWYHPHSHGEAYWQVTSGMSGAIVVEGLTQRLPELAGLRERILILRDVQDRPNIFSIPWYARKGTVALEMAAARKLGVTKYHPTDPDDSAPGGSCSPEHGLHVTIEGTQQGQMPIAPGERQFFRVLNASAGRIFDLALDGARLGLVAIDGYPLHAYPGTPRIAWVDHVVVPPAGRAEFIVVGQDHEALLRSRCYDSGPAGDRDPPIVLARLEPNVQGTSSGAGGLAPASDMRPQLQATPIPVGASATSRIVTFTEDNNGYYINHEAFDMMSMKPMMTVRSGTLEQWTLENDTDEVHAFHIHQVHFAVLSMNGKPVSLRYWQDTALVPSQRHVGRKSLPGRITILLDFRNPAIKGTFPFHCHMLDHEDAGMMALVKVI